MNKPKILIIEDTKSVRESLRDLLNFEGGVQVIVSANGQEGIDKAKEHLPNLILCDIMMPIKDGYQVFNELRHDIDLKHTPFIFLTAQTGIDTIKQKIELGVDDDIVTKPFNSDLLLSSIAKALKKD
jgi:two-component system sensor kinase|tara:strand:+ start:40 stop:420 length:381 start_codon:yes stop_codon:yes gene_type:complete